MRPGCECLAIQTRCDLSDSVLCELLEISLHKKIVYENAYTTYHQINDWIKTSAKCMSGIISSSSHELC